MTVATLHGYMSLIPTARLLQLTAGFTTGLPHHRNLKFVNIGPPHLPLWPVMPTHMPNLRRYSLTFLNLNGVMTVAQSQY